ncbi:major facilitator superfamily MFS_1 [Catenulispora acidiphila DSM 44928]|uniref:Major facilitator superfamily MFS_1 n=1 Tax=Catenulispora acidiphila (strain DSM 44928 / JCM 14897 / NBRC 102108 / NRRL B-24433 / ID139908) TaxID=479433 RepID=C7QIE4_CATAD|nr:major facilitator superfamily MFS_1 [Catenulispora acidiphila DSM 44928]
MATPPRTHKETWSRAALALTAVGWGANQFAPMVLLYRERMGVSASAAEAIFGLYAAGLVPGLLIAGPLSDRVGRRPVVAFAVLLSMISGVVLMLGSHGLGWLSTGRVLMGIASGAAFSAGSAWVKELSATNAVAGAGARRASIAMTAGFGIGPLIAGVLVQWGPAAYEVPYIPQLILAAAALFLLAGTPETVQRWPSGILGGGLLRLRGFSDRRFVGVVLPMAPWVFGAATIAMVYLPGLSASHVKGISLVFAGTAAMVTAMSGVAIQPFARRVAASPAGQDRARPRLLTLGLALVTVGTLAEAGVAALNSLGAWQAVLTLVVAVVMGFGYGILLVFGLAEVQRLAPPEDLAGMTAVFQAFTYLGFAAPYLLSALKNVASPSTLLLAVAALGVLTIAVTVRNARVTAKQS